MAFGTGSNTPDDSLPREFYMKSLVDPVTEKSFSTIAVKSNASTLRGRDPDFAPQYDGINPMHYGVIVTPSGFAAEEGIFKRSPKLLFKDKDALKAYLANLSGLPDFNVIRPLALVCKSYDMAITCSEFLRMPRFERAALCLKGSWVYRELYDEGHKMAMQRIEELRNIALELYLVAYEKEDTSRTKMGSAGIGHLIGELLREQGRFDESLRWFSRIVTDKQTGAEIKRIARNQMDLCREQREKAMASGEYSKPEPERMKERSMYQLYRDQSRWLTGKAHSLGMAESDVLRGIIDGLKEVNPEFGGAEDEEQIANWIAARLGQGNK